MSWLALLGLAEAASCCTATGIDPLVLSQGEAVAALVSSDLGFELDEIDSATSVGGLLRVRPWLLLGARTPILLGLDAKGPRYGLGHSYAWGRLEARPGDSTLMAWSLGLGSVGPESGVGTGSLRIETGPAFARGQAGSLDLVQLVAKLPVAGVGSWDLSPLLVVARPFPGGQVGGRLGAELKWLEGGSGWVGAGPSVWLGQGQQRVEIWTMLAPVAWGVEDPQLRLGLTWLVRNR